MFHPVCVCLYMCIYIYVCVCIYIYNIYICVSVYFFPLNNLLRLSLHLDFLCCSVRFQSAAFILCDLLPPATLYSLLMQSRAYKHLDYLRYTRGTNKGKARGLVPSTVQLIFKNLFSLFLLFRIVPVACNSMPSFLHR
jgi:hypothetical protein